MGNARSIAKSNARASVAVLAAAISAAAIASSRRLSKGAQHGHKFLAKGLLFSKGNLTNGGEAIYTFLK